MKSNEFDKEYYVMDADKAPNHPKLVWGASDCFLLIQPKAVEKYTINLPLQLEFSQPYPKLSELADILHIPNGFVVSEKVKRCIEKMNIYGTQFFPIDVKQYRAKKAEGYYFFRIWNRISAIDKNNYVGDKPNQYGTIYNLEKFSLDKTVMEKISLGKRLAFHLKESTTKRLIHQSVYDALMAENVTGGSFFRMDRWGDDA